MDQSIYSRSAQILRKFDAETENTMVVLYEPGFTTPWDVVNSVRYYGFITDLRLKVDVQSIEETEIPNLDVTSTRTERLVAVREMEWSSARKELHLFLETSQQPATQIAAISLLNRRPYYHVNLIPYFTDNGIINIANDARILGRVVDAGYGLLSATDEVVVFGSVKEEITTLPEDAPQISYCQPYSWTINTSSLQILPANQNRLQLTLVNRGSSTIYLNYGTLAEVGKGIVLLPGGGSYEINSTNPYLGVISAISEVNGGLLSGLECV